MHPEQILQSTLDYFVYLNSFLMVLRWCLQITHFEVGEGEGKCEDGRMFWGLT